MNPFAVDYTNLEEVKTFAKKLTTRNSPTMYVIKHPNYPNYNITMQLQKAKDEGCEIICAIN